MSWASPTTTRVIQWRRSVGAGVDTAVDPVEGVETPVEEDMTATLYGTVEFRIYSVQEFNPLVTWRRTTEGGEGDDAAR
jgi:hypothetical protein